MDGIIAKWWRAQLSRCPSLHDMVLPVDLRSAKPKTQLQYIARHYDDCRLFLKCEEKRLRKGLGRNDAIAHAELASFAMWRGDVAEAKKLLETAIRLGGEESKFQLELAKVNKQIEADRRRVELVEERGRHPNSSQMFEEIDRHEQISESQFLSEYAFKGRPVIVTGIVEEMCGGKKWDFDFLVEKIGDKRIMLKKRVTQSAEWAQLEDASLVTARDFLNFVKNSPAGDSTRAGEYNGRYLFDWQLPVHAPDLLDNFRVPKIVSHDLLQSAPPGTLFRDCWPSLFIPGDSATRGSVHVDTFASNFWMALLHGEKDWTIFRSSDTPLLYPSFTHSLDPSFPDIDFLSLNSDSLPVKYPAVKFAKGWRARLKAGEFLYVPHSSAHIVANVTKTIALSANYIDRTNVEAAVKALADISIVDATARDLLVHLSKFQQSESEDEISLAGDEESTVSWVDYKSPQKATRKRKFDENG